MYKNENIYIKNWHLDTLTLMADLSDFSYKIPNFVSIDFSRTMDEFNFVMCPTIGRDVLALVCENEFFVPDSDDLMCVDCVKLDVGSIVAVRKNILVPDRFYFLGEKEIVFPFGNVGSRKELWNNYEVLYPL